MEQLRAHIILAHMNFTPKGTNSSFEKLFLSEYIFGLKPSKGIGITLTVVIFDLNTPCDTKSQI